MGGSVRLFRVEGIDIRMHLTFPLILIWGALQFGLLAGRGLQGAIFGVLVTLMLFVIVVLHELGHSMAARRYGVAVKQIILLPIGGVAQLERIPDEPVQELVIAAAGPLVNFVIAGLMLGLAGLFPAQLGLGGLSSILTTLGTMGGKALFGYLFVSNLVLALFNLLPAFPMDGGRILRALLATRLEYSQATSIAVTIGRAMALLIGLWGVLNGGLFVVMLAIFVFLGAGQEGQRVQVTSVLKGMTVAEAYSRGLKPLAPMSTLEDAVRMTLSSAQTDFPVLSGDRVVGVLTHHRLIDAWQRYGPDAKVAEVMEPAVVVARPTDPLSTVQQEMSERNLEAVPVVEEGRFLGLISLADLAEVFRFSGGKSRWNSPGKTAHRPI